MSKLRIQHTTPGFRAFAGNDALRALPKELKRTGSSRAFIITSPSVTRADGVLDHINEAAGGAIVGTFADVREHSPVEVVEAARDALVESGADAIIAVGGGSAVVTARAASILLAEGKHPRELCTRRNPDGSMTSPRLDAPKVPNWVIPSTPTTAYAKAGSAVRDVEAGERLALFDPKTRAQGIFVDPLVAATAPVALSVSASLNAFSMCIEGLQSGMDDPLAEALLAHALDLFADLLPAINKTPDDTDVRMRLMLASLLAGQGSDFAGGGLAQALSHAAGPRSNVANGVVEAMLLEPTMRFNAPVSAAGLAKVATILSSHCPTDIEGVVEVATASVRRVLDACDVPVKLREVGLDSEALVESVDHALDDWMITRIPKAASRDDLINLMEASW